MALNNWHRRLPRPLPLVAAKATQSALGSGFDAPDGQISPGDRCPPSLGSDPLPQGLRRIPHGRSLAYQWPLWVACFGLGCFLSVTLPHLAQAAPAVQGDPGGSRVPVTQGIPITQGVTITQGDRSNNSGSNADRPNADRSNTHISNLDRSNLNRPNFDRPNFDRPNFDRPNTNISNPDRSNTHISNTDRPNTDRPSNLAPGVAPWVAPPQPHPLPPTLAAWVNPDPSGGDYFGEIRPSPVGYLLWSQFPIRVYGDAPTLGDGSAEAQRQERWSGAVDRAIALWQAYLPLVRVTDAQEADIVVRRSRPALVRRSDGSLEPARTAQTRYQFRLVPQGEAGEADVLMPHFTIHLDPAQGADFLTATLGHELGHALGLWGHSPNPQDLLYARQTAQPLSPSPRDLETLRQVYGQATAVGWPVPRVAPERSPG